jgi:hypothetical protein
MPDDFAETLGRVRTADEATLRTAAASNDFMLALTASEGLSELQRLEEHLAALPAESPDA